MKIQQEKRPICLLGSQRGMSLVELLVAMVIGLVLMAGVYQTFVGSTTAYDYNEQLARLQENGRFALNFMAEDIRIAAYRGCENDANLVNTLKNATRLPYQYAVGIDGYDNVSAPLPTALSDAGIAPKAGTDVLILRGKTSNGSPVLANHVADANIDLPLEVIEPNVCSDGSDRYNGICQGDILLASDCRTAVVFQVTALGATGGGGTQQLRLNHAEAGSPGNDTPSWTGINIGSDAEVVKYATKTYFVQNNAEGEPSLYRQIDAEAAQEMVPGVESLQVLYGEDITNDGGVDTYVDASAVSNWDRVLAARIGLLVRSPDEIGKKKLDTETYLVNGVNVDPVDDRRMREVYVSTVGIRNRLP